VVNVVPDRKHRLRTNLFELCNPVVNLVLRPRAFVSAALPDNRRIRFCCHEAGSVELHVAQHVGLLTDATDNRPPKVFVGVAMETQDSYFMWVKLDLAPVGGILDELLNISKLVCLDFHILRREHFRSERFIFDNKLKKASAINERVPNPV
jgi:hypothetical protein